MLHVYYARFVSGMHGCGGTLNLEKKMGEYLPNAPGHTQRDGMDQRVFTIPVPFAASVFIVSMYGYNGRRSRVVARGGGGLSSPSSGCGLTRAHATGNTRAGERVGC